MQVNMFSKTSKVTSSDSNANSTNAKKGVPSVISTGTHILGNMVSDGGTVDIDGSIEGNVKAEQVTVRGNGKIMGDISANAVHIYGEVRGLIRARSVHLYSSAHITGIIVHQSLTVEDGAFIDAKFKRMSDVSMQAADPINDTDSDDGLIESAPSFVGAGTLRLIG